MDTISRHASSLALLVGLLFGFFVMMSYQVNRTETVTAFEGTVQTVVSPAHRLLSSVWLGIARGWTNYVGMIGRASEVELLREQLAVAQRRIKSLEETSRDNTRLRQALGFQSKLELPSMASQVIGRDMAHAYETITVNRGSFDGIVDNAPAIAANGAVVGRVVHVGPFTATVQLITDPKSAVGAKVLRSGAHGVVHGVGGALLELRYVTSLEDVREGDVIVTSGEDAIYPAGLEIGRVVRAVQGAPVPGLPRLPLARTETALFLDIDLEPVTEVRRVDQVLLLTPVSDGG